MATTINLDDYHLENLVEILSSSDDIQVVENIKAALKESLANESVVTALFDHYVVSNSLRVQDLLSNVREPLDRVVFDKLTDLLKIHPGEALNLLFYLIHRQVAWMHKISGHSLFTALLKLGKNTKDVPVLIGWLFVWCVLMPIVPLLTPSSLGDIFFVFLRSCQILAKPSTESELVGRSLRVAVYALFQRLYGMYPCNFLSFMRKNFAEPSLSMSNRRMFNDVIKPMLEHVKIHPLLVTAPKEQELTKERWCHLEPHDVVGECAKLSFDPFEIGLTTFGATSTSAVNTIKSYSYESENSCELESQTCPTLSVINDVNKRALVEEGNKQDVKQVDGGGDSGVASQFWSPSMVVGLMTPPGMTPSNSAIDLSLRHRDGSRSNSALGQPLARTSGSFSSHFNSADKNRHTSEASSLRRRHQSGLSGALARVFGSKDSSSVPPSPAKPHSGGADQEDIFKFPPPTATARTESGLTVRRNLSSISQTEEAMEAVEELSVTETIVESPDLKPLTTALRALTNDVLKPDNEMKLDAEVNEILKREIGEPTAFEPSIPVKFCMSDFYSSRPSVASNNTGTSSPKSDVQWDKVNRLSGVSDKTTESSGPSASSFDYHRKCSVISLGSVAAALTTEKPASFIGHPCHSVTSDVISESPWVLPSNEPVGPSHVQPDVSQSAQDEAVHIGMLEEPNMAEVPRLTTSGSVANFMNRINRIRFHSHCVPGANEENHQFDSSSGSESDSCDVTKPTDVVDNPVSLPCGGFNAVDMLAIHKKISDSTVEKKFSRGSLFRGRASSCPPSKMKRPREKFRKISMEPRGVKVKPHRNSLQGGQEPLILHVHHGMADLLQQMQKSMTPSDPGLMLISPPSNSKLAVISAQTPSQFEVVDGPVVSGPLSERSADMADHLAEISSAILPGFGAQSKVSRPDSEAFAHLPSLINFLSLRPQTFGVKRGTSGDAVSPSPFELFDNYVHSARRMHDFTDSQNESREHSSQVDAEWKTKVELVHQQLLFERYKRQMQWQEARKLFSKMQQSVVRDEEIRALKDQIFRQDEEITNLVVALTDLRKQNVNQKEEHRSKEYSLNMQLQKAYKDLEKLKQDAVVTATTLTEANQQIGKLQTQLGSTKQKLLGVEVKLQEATDKLSDREVLKADADESRKRLLLLSELNVLLNESLNRANRQLKIHESCGERWNLLRESSTRELGDLKKQLRRQITKYGAANKKVEELEQAAVKRQEQLGSLKIQLEMARETHREQMTAAQAKYLALERVCHRQESHILELYAHLEQGAYTRRRSRDGCCPQEPIVIPDNLGPKEILSLGHSGTQASSGANDWYLPFLFNDTVVRTTGSDGDESGFHQNDRHRSGVVVPLLDEERFRETSQPSGIGGRNAVSHTFPPNTRGYLE